MEETYNSYGYIDTSVFAAIIAIGCALILIQIIAYWKIFSKAGEAGWLSIVPVLNFYILLKIVGKPGWWILLLFIPLVNLIIAVITVHALSRSFGKDVGFTLGLIFLPFIFYPILEFSDAKYRGPAGNPAAFAAAHGDSNRFEFEQENR